MSHLWAGLAKTEIGLSSASTRRVWIHIRESMIRNGCQWFQQGQVEASFTLRSMPLRKRPPKGFLARIDSWRIVGPMAAASSTNGGPSGITAESTDSVEMEPPHQRQQLRPPQQVLPSPLQPPQLADRPDRPNISVTKRGSMDLATTRTMDEEWRAGAMAALEGDFDSSSSKKTRASYVRTL